MGDRIGKSRSAVGTHQTWAHVVLGMARLAPEFFARTQRLLPFAKSWAGRPHTLTLRLQTRVDAPAMVGVCGGRSYTWRRTSCSFAHVTANGPVEQLAHVRVVGLRGRAGLAPSSASRRGYPSPLVLRQEQLCCPSWLFLPSLLSKFPAFDVTLK